MSYTISYTNGSWTDEVVSPDAPVEHSNPQYAGPDGMVIVTRGTDGEGRLWRELIDVAWITSIEVTA